ncbi:2-amino-4-hydroxy-6-hydroxymethyldihydropteridine diphosphokinase [Rhodopirellula sp. JC740]|uniref:2-amino-4-hydroxy-6-hydroxymethyldihydropteridine pyrophosphokinase n=2 Tax=Rhodopirellula halodulae TaxID=2894198 RepID=A0ABS8NAY5_9BACT|nr:2-amino-4-hydroxy-6-hydroxymethyldihydropteridine diphosphokinase [Rhodopirellula sp. JC740]MCC9640733.1 2-amino-4-hydroxy-6-hydroxymethyldihydropteridine diphosphokinase [Rhodopirellula sp. JC740]
MGNFYSGSYDSRARSSPAHVDVFMPIQCLISFGSNLGDRREVIAEAARRVADSGVIEAPCQRHVGDALVSSSAPLRTSRLFETPPIGGPGGQSPFLNAVAAFATEASAAEVLDVLQRLELDLGRERIVRWGARVIDLDVVLHGKLAGPSATAGRRGLIGGRGPAGSSKALVVPHPRYTARRFVLEPACDVAADFCDPRFGWTLKDLRDHIALDVPSIALVGGDAELRQSICQRLSEEHGITVIDPDRPGSAKGLKQWVAADPPMVLRDTQECLAVNAEQHCLPRLLARIQHTTEKERWPAPHQIWPAGWKWPEYRLEVEDLDWAIGELASAIDAMRCEIHPVTENGQWW